MHAHTFLVWTCYFLGQVLHILVDSSSVVKNKANVINSYKAYFSAYWTTIAARFFLLSCMFPFVWDNPSAFDIQGVMHTTGTQIGASGILGWFCDSAWDKLLSFMPWLKGKLPEVPGVTT